MVNIKLEITHDEPVLLASQALPVVHSYDEPLDTSIASYSLEEIGAEKLRATRQTLAKLEQRGWARSRGRDYYDLWHMIGLPPERRDWAIVERLLPDKGAHRGVKIESIADLFEPKLLERVRSEWKQTLGSPSCDVR